jgi:TetR/AcrR family fatty acid metabolism transcriptional regulator
MRKQPKITQRVNNINPESDRRKRVLTSALKVFGEKGFKNATISEIAKEAGVGDATIYEYFDSKEALLLSIPFESTKDIIAEINYHMIGIKGTFNKLRKFVWWWLNYLEENPGYAVITLLELKVSKNYMQTESYEKAREFYHIILDILKEGQEEGVIKKEVNIYLARSVIIGALEHNIIRWLLKERNYSLLQYADELVDLLIDMLKSTESDT